MHQSAGRVVNKRQKRALRRAILKPRMLRSIDLNQLAQAISPAAGLSNKLARGSFSAAFMLQVLSAIGTKTVRVAQEDD
jgi:hypothetical protein